MLPSRKPNRLKEYDYSQNGAYFITFCTKNKENLFWNVGASIARPQDGKHLSAYGKTVVFAIENINKHYPMISVEHYTIMPNHIHLLLLIQQENGRAMHAPTISTVIQHLKGFVSKKTGLRLFQKSFHDRIIRNQKEYLEIYKYIENNPLQWSLDCFYNAP